MDNNNNLEDALQAYLCEDEPTAIMSAQLLREKLAESTVPEPPDTVPACPDALRASRSAPRAISGVRPRLTFGSYLRTDLRPRRAR